MLRTWKGTEVWREKFLYFMRVHIHAFSKLVRVIPLDFATFFFESLIAAVKPISECVRMACSCLMTATLLQVVSRLAAS